MKALKIIVIVIAAIVAVFLIATIFLPSKYHIERSISIKAPSWQIFTRIHNLHNWPKWDPWMETDPKQVRVYDDKPGLSGSSYKWSSDNKQVGHGKLSILDAKAYNLINLGLEFEGMPMSKGSISIEESNGISKVKWWMDGEMHNFSKWFNLMMDNVAGAEFEKGLGKLKTVCEEMPKANIEFKVTDINPMTILFVNDSVQMDVKKISEAFMKDYGEIGKFMRMNKIEMAGAPLAITNNMANNMYNFDAGIPIKAADLPLAGNVKYGSTPGGKVLLAIQKGPYEQAPASYEMIMKYIGEKGLKIRDRSYEVYMNDPGTVNPDNILTYIYFPIE